ncbi:hypothetical protein [Halomonas ramblicola]|uniref:hypothetical protein n=1 Tax=Halomonas ramblicola TaxID=747349 RepID=UPI0025B299B9|nr:hypothetical protein [Halomonas ramblicola]MDN3523523.1 hypothetical protein [Halomonas ramblicola]
MSPIPHINSKAEDVQEIAEAINTIARLVNDDLVRKASEGIDPFLSDAELGGLMLAVEHLSTRAGDLAEDLYDDEQRLAKLATQHNDGEGKS